MWEKVKKIIRRHKAFVVTTHVFPDGDAVGAQLGLAQILRRLGKRVLTVNEFPVPKVYRFLDPRGTVKVLDERLAGRVRKCDVAFVMDVGSLERVGAVGAAIREGGLTTVCIDHHKTNSRFADANVVRTSAASTSELVLELANALRVPVTSRMAACLFVGLATDTGWFRFPNTSPACLRHAAELAEKGAVPHRIYEAVYESFDWGRMALMRSALRTLRLDCDGRLASLCITRRMLEEAGAAHEDAEDFVDLPRELASVELIVLFRETDDGIKVSLRSKRGPAVDGLAKRHGGGGHARAAGLVLRETLRAAQEIILSEVAELLAARKA